jgi:prepilin-type N-terminal cleavage/methylation domain-containing protein
MIDGISKYKKNAGFTPLEISETNHSKTKRKRLLSLTGFTLVEIIVVVAIIALLAAISIPLMIRNHITANEASAIASCRTIVSACQSYYSYSMPRVYPADLVVLGTAGPAGPAYIDNVLASGAKSGYDFTYARTSLVSFTLNADPQVPGRTGVRYFYSDETGRISAREGGPAGPGDPAIN